MQFPNWGGDLSVDYNISYNSNNPSQPPIPILRVSIHDLNKTEIAVLMNDVPNQLSGTITYDTSSLSAGFYFVLFQFGDQVEVVGFIKQ